MLRWLLGICLVLAAGCAGAARAAVDLTGEIIPAMTYGTAAQAAAAVTGGSYSGVGSLFITRASGSASLCSGALVSSNVMLTAAHCLYGSDAVTSVSVYLPSFGEQSATSTYQMSSFSIAPTYNGNVLAGSDIAVMTLSSYALGHDTYQLYMGDPLTAFTRVGTGTIGDYQGQGSGTGTNYDYKQRTGNNLYDIYGSQLFSNVASDVLMYDFDAYGASDAYDRDGFGRFGIHQLGVGGEASTSPGDSGGPSFIGSQIAGITSFGVSLGCGSGYADPYAGANNNCTNFSIGELAGDTRAASHAAFVNGYVAAAAAVPEPAQWAMLLVGFGMIGGALRRTRVCAFA